MDNPLVSLLVPVYNVQEYLAECLDSIVNQTLREIEIIIVNDGSTDGSRAIAEEYCSKDPRMRLINQENRGLGAARNTAIPHAAGKYILFVDSDDYLGTETVETLYKKAEKDGTRILLYNGSGFYDYSSKTEKKYVFDKKSFLKLNEKDEKMPVTGLEFAGLHSAIASAYMKLFDRKFIHENNLLFPEGVLGEDMEFNYRCMVSADKVAYIHYFGYFRRYRPDSIMTGSGAENITDRIHSFPGLIKIIENEEIKQRTEESQLHLKQLAAQIALYATGLWVMAMCRKDKTERTRLVSDYRKNGINNFVKQYKKGFYLHAASLLITLPDFFQPVMHIACIVVKKVFRSRTDLFI